MGLTGGGRGEEREVREWGRGVFSTTVDEPNHLVSRNTIYYELVPERNIIFLFCVFHAGFRELENEF